MDNYVIEVCARCGDRYCCHGMCKEMNEYLVKKRDQKKSGSKSKKSFK